MTKSLADRSIIVTGGASGIGLATAKLLAAHGARLAIADANDAGEEAANAIAKDGGEAFFFKTDVSQEDEVKALVAETVRRYGRLDGAFNNAGVSQAALPLHEISWDVWNRTIQIDLAGVFFCLKHEIAAMLETGGGSLVNTASGLGQVAIPHAGEYVAAKHGVVGLTRAAAVDYGRRNIRVNAILPGIISTPMVADLVSNPDLTGAFDEMRERHPMGRFGLPEEIGAAVRWLLSDEASFMTGAMIPVDGGYLAV